MVDKQIIHMMTPLKHMSPFDTNMALDAGYDAAIPYASVDLSDVPDLVQDAIFSRPPKLGMRTGVFIGGKNAILALEMLDAAKNAMVPPFEISLFADPAGSFTTGAAMMACVEKVLKEKKGRDLRGLKVAIFGATGVVGFAAAVIAALEGADVTLVGHAHLKRLEEIKTEMEARFGITVRTADGTDEEKKTAILKQAEVALCAARAGVRVLTSAQLAEARNLLVVADVNAVPPTGVEGLDVMGNGVEITPHGTLGIGALAVGNIKYKTEFGLFQKMIEAAKPVTFDFRDAFQLARELSS
jgi:methylene-tetrahydromethanopterin dehydrogenase